MMTGTVGGGRRTGEKGGGDRSALHTHVHFIFCGAADGSVHLSLYLRELIAYNSYAGWLGTVAERHKEDGKLSAHVPSLGDSRHRLAAVAGTSTCHIVQVSC